MYFIFLHKNKIHKWIAIILVTLFALFISYERIVIGAHYTSDILFSGGIVIMIFLILYKKYFLNKEYSLNGKIYSTFATRDLCTIMLQDSAHIQEKDVEYVNKKRKRDNAD